MASRQTIMFNSDDEEALKVIKDSINTYADRFNNTYNQSCMSDDTVSVYVGNICEMLNENYTNYNRTQTEYDSVNFNDIIYKISDELYNRKLNSEVFADYLYDSRPQCMIKIDQKGADVIYNYHNQMVPIDSLEDDAEFDESNFQLVSTKEAIDPPYKLYDSAFSAYQLQNESKTNEEKISKYDTLKHMALKTVDQDTDREIEM